MLEGAKKIIEFTGKNVEAMDGGILEGKSQIGEIIYITDGDQFLNGEFGCLYSLSCHLRRKLNSIEEKVPKD